MSETPQTTETLIESWAELQFGPDEIALALDLDASEVRRRTAKAGDPWCEAYRRGQLKAEAAVRKAVYTAATQGSIPAQREFVRLVGQRRRLDAARPAKGKGGKG